MQLKELTRFWRHFMKILLVSSLGILLLSGCDNFRRIEPLPIKPVAPLAAENTQSEPAPNMEGSVSTQNGTVTQKQTKPKIATETALETVNYSATPNPLPPPAPVPPLAKAAELTPTPAQKNADETKATSTAEAKKTQLISKKPEEKSNTEVTGTGTPEKKDEKENKKADSSKKSEAVAGEKLGNSEVLSVTDIINLNSVARMYLTKEIFDTVKVAIAPKTMNAKEVSASISGNFEKFSFSLGYQNNTLAEFKDLSLDLTKANIYKSNDFEGTFVCIGGNCEILFVTVTKLDDKSNIVENYPNVLKLVNGNYVKAVFKSEKEYIADRSQLTEESQIKFAPQIEVFKKLEEHLNATMTELGNQFKAQLDKRPNAVYTDSIITGKDVKEGSFDPIIKRQDGKLTISAQIEYNTDQKTNTFAGNISTSPPGELIKTESGLTMVVIPRVKDQVFLVILEQAPYKSKLAGINTGVQAAICYLLEAEHPFTGCAILSTATIFQENGVVEASTKDKIRAE
jgi:hypothetical protein